MHSRFLLVPAFLCGTITLTASAQDQLLKQQERLQAVAIQKVEHVIADAMSDARRLQRGGSTLRATERLRLAIQQLDDPILPRAKVDAWRTQLNEAIRAIERGNKPAVADAGPGKEGQIARVKSMIEEEKNVRRSVDTVASLMRAGDVAKRGKRWITLPRSIPRTRPCACCRNSLPRR